MILEAQNSPGGASLISGGGCCLVGTPLQKQHGIKDDVDLAIADWTKMGGPTADLRWARKYLENSKTEVYDWVEGIGIQWISIIQPEGNTVPRWHQPADYGRGIVQALLKHADTQGIKIRTSSEAKQLLFENGAIRGVDILDHQGPRTVLCRKVVVCTGGFSGNLDRVLASAPHLQKLPRILSGGSAAAKGTGHTLMTKVGANLVNQDHIWVYPVGTPDPTDQDGRRGLGIRGLKGDIWLNRDGHRFHNEAQKGGRSGTAALLSQPGQTAFMIFSATEIPHVELINNSRFFPPPPQGMLPALKTFWEDSAYAWRANGIEELAKAIGLPTAEVLSSFDTFNSDVAAGLEKDSRFGRPLAARIPLESDLAAVQLFPMAQKTFGGVRTDLNCRVLDIVGEPIVGLYAAGEVAGMAGGCINGKAAIEGTMYGPCLYSGRVAGITASSDALEG